MSEVKLYMSLLEEGTPTMRGAQAISLGNNLYKILPTPDYSPETEVWEFDPDTIVMGQERYTDKNEKVILAIRIPEPRKKILEKHSGASLIPMGVHAAINGKKTVKETEAIDLKNKLYKLLPTDDYDPATHIWEYTPGSVVRAIKGKNDKGQEILIAFDQIREDMMDGYYARHVTEND